MKTATISIIDCLHFDCPTAQQKSSLLAMAEFVKEDNKDDFLILCGAAGTGKSSIMSALISYLNARGCAYQMATPTGRAARILGRKTDANASTVHSMIYHTAPNPETGVVHCTLKSAKDETQTIFIVDESSMVGALPQREDGSLFVTPGALLTDLLQYIRSGNAANKVIFLGDRNQLPPIGERDSYALQADYLRTQFGWQGSSHLLTEVKRQEDGSYILKTATRIREAIDSGGRVSIEAPHAGSLPHAVPLYLADFKSKGSDYCISIGRSHRQNRYFNDLVRKQLFGGNVRSVEAGDLMLVMQSWSRNGHMLYNGDHVTVEEVCLDKTETVAGLQFVPVKLRYRKMDGTEAVVDDYLSLNCLYNENGLLTSEQEKAIRFERNKKNRRYQESGNPEDDRYVGAIHLNYGHSITCNKAQGGEWDKVFVNAMGTAHDMKWSYTAVTRAKTSLVQY